MPPLQPFTLAGARLLGASSFQWMLVFLVANLFNDALQLMKSLELLSGTFNMTNNIAYNTAMRDASFLAGGAESLDVGH